VVAQDAKHIPTRLGTPALVLGCPPVTVYVFEQIGADLDLMPLAARRAADLAGVRPSLAAWRSLPLEQRAALVDVGSVPGVELQRVLRILAASQPPAQSIEPEPDPSPSATPASLLAILGEARPLTAAVWSALEPLARYSLVKVARAGEAERERVAAAYDEIVGASAHSSHLDASGKVRMVSVSEKVATARRAVAGARVSMNAEAFGRLVRADAPKGDVLGTARLAGIMAAKRTSDLIPLCHPIALTRVDVALELEPEARAVDVRATVEAFDRTGVEMEALTAASAAALTVYDMLKAFDRGMLIDSTRLLAKSGGKSGDFLAPVRPRSEVGARFAVRAVALSIDEAVSLVARPEAGGICVFIGTVRDHNAGRSVRVLEYEAYTSMAVKEMERIGTEVEAEIEGTRLAVLHRVGELAVGDTAVICAASAPHRDEAFRACRALIDRIKQRVPIWKREHDANGASWVGWEDAR
jgi:molybdenum cofactor biosynthesis protein MoaC